MGTRRKQCRELLRRVYLPSAGFPVSWRWWGGGGRLQNFIPSKASHIKDSALNRGKALLMSLKLLPKLHRGSRKKMGNGGKEGKGKLENHKQ